jgi:glutathione S-transferase
MTKLRLISHRLCPYVQRAVIVLDEKGAAFEREDIDLGNKPEWFLKLSPLGKVPLLTVEENGRTEVIFESAVIAEYLDETIEPRLHPQAAIERARHRAWIEFASATLADVAGFYAASDEEQFTSKRDSLEAKFARVEEALSREAKGECLAIGFAGSAKREKGGFAGLPRWPPRLSECTWILPRQPC